MSETNFALYSPSDVEVTSSLSTVNSPGSAPLSSPEAFQKYCEQVQNRLAEKAAHRRQFLMTAHERLSALLQAARAIDDNGLCRELQQQQSAARELIESLSRLPGETHTPTHAAVAMPHPPAPSRPRPHESRNGHHSNGNQEITARTLFPGETPAPVPPLQPVSEAPQPASNVPRRPVRPLADIEADAMQIRAMLKTWHDRHPLLQPSGELHVPSCLRLRAVACRQRRLEEEAGDTEVAEVTELGDDIEALLDAAGDEEYTVALEYDLDPLPTAYQWGEMAERYEEMACAQEAFTWWNRHWHELTVADVQPLAEAVAAIQQRFNRLLFRVGARDPFQQQLFDDLRAWAKEQQCYLHSLRPKVPIAELVDRAHTLESAWDRAAEAVITPEQQQKALAMLTELLALETFGNHEEDAQKLCAVLLDCRQVRIPVNHPELHTLIQPHTPLFAEDDRFREIIRAIEKMQETEQKTELEPCDA